MQLSVIQSGFDCTRTCPQFERRDFCRFNSLLSAVGVTTSVNSHTIKIDVSFSSVAGLTAAVEHYGGTVHGFGTHKLFAENTVDGFGFTLPGWAYRLVVDGTGAVNVDEFLREENAVSIDQLKNRYCIESAKIASGRLGWLSELTTDENGNELLRVYHPSGGYLDVNSTVGVDANGFNGNGCHTAARELATAAGTITEQIPKPEFYNQTNQQFTAQ